MWLVHGYFDNSWVNWQGLLLQLRSGRLVLRFFLVKFLDIPLDSIQFAERVQFHRWFPTPAIRIHYADLKGSRTVTLGMLFGARRERLLQVFQKAGVQVR